MKQFSDHELIARYAFHQDHDAFAQLVHRYIALVRSAALRQTREAALADDVTQAAIIVLARRAREIPSNVVLASWLYTVTHHLAHHALKSRARRTAHEQVAAEQRTRGQSIDHADGELRDVLDAAIARLPEIERGGVVLHFFNDRTHEEIGEALGMTGEAVRKRVSRALIKMRDFVAGRGFDLSTQTLATTLAAESASRMTVAAHTTHSIVNLALLTTAGGATATSTSAILANGILGGAKTALKWKIAASIALTTVGFTGVATSPLSAPAVQATAVVNQNTVPAPAATQPAGIVAQVTRDIRIIPLGCAPHPAEPEQWFAFDGKPIDLPHERLIENNINSDNQPDRQMAFLVESPPSMRFMLEIKGAFTSNVNADRRDGEDFSLVRARFGLNDPAAETLSVAFNISTSDWKTLATAECGAEPAEVDSAGSGPVTFHPPVEDPRWGPMVEVHHGRADATVQLLAMDANGKEHIHQTHNSDNDGADRCVSKFVFDVPAKDIRSVKLQFREFDNRVEITNIAMQADQHTQPKIEVKDLKAKK